MLDPTTMVADLRRRAKKLLTAAEAIEEAYGLKRISMDYGLSVDNSESQADTAVSTAVMPLERKEQLIRFLKEHGPKRRSEIKIHSGIPVGTLSHLLKDTSAFNRLPDGRWSASTNDYVKMDLEQRSK